MRSNRRASWASTKPTRHAPRSWRPSCPPMSSSMPGLARCMEDGMSTRGTQGIGLGAVARQSQVFDVHSDANGSVVLSRLHAKQRANVDLRYGAAVHAYEGEPVCGDG